MNIRNLYNYQYLLFNKYVAITMIDTYSIQHWTSYEYTYNIWSIVIIVGICSVIMFMRSSTVCVEYYRLRRELESQ